MNAQEEDGLRRRHFCERVTKLGNLGMDRYVRCLLLISPLLTLQWVLTSVLVLSNVCRQEGMQVIVSLVGMLLVRCYGTLYLPLLDMPGGHPPDIRLQVDHAKSTNPLPNYKI